MGGRARLERRLFELAGRLRAAREELAVMEAQAESFDDEAEAAKVTSLLREAPRVYEEAQRHADAMRGARRSLEASIARMQADQERLISRLGSTL